MIRCAMKKMYPPNAGLRRWGAPYVDVAVSSGVARVSDGVDDRRTGLRWFGQLLRAAARSSTESVDAGWAVLN